MNPSGTLPVRVLGTCGIAVPTVGIGCWGIGGPDENLGRLVTATGRDALVLSSKVGYFAGAAPHGFDPGHMRRQLNQTLANLHTDHLDLYFLHHADFGPADIWLEGAVDAIHTFKREGLIRAVGMRGPHRYALDRLTTPPNLQGGKVARFRGLFDTIRPDVLAVRDNLLTPPATSEGIFAFAADRHLGVLITTA
ncbi:aldo/keto reductase [Frankia sp. Cr1]|uniref:aldo/keto reductase n=1 Tax=Frankia sp. Cr1 TaxID=3073931 RepID=UPI002AD55048|nr:aldo/keto reductase [Frankia sp. Cr1]